MRAYYLMEDSVWKTIVAAAAGVTTLLVAWSKLGPALITALGIQSATAAEAAHRLIDRRATVLEGKIDALRDEIHHNHVETLKAIHKE